MTTAIDHRHLIASRHRSLTGVTRTFHAVDVENLVGSGRPGLADVSALRSLYNVCVQVKALDQVVIACNPGCLLDVGVGWAPGRARYRVGAGKSGADLALIDVLESEGVSRRFSRVVIASGDGIFAPLAARLGAAGCKVTVVSRRNSLSTRLRQAVRRVIYLDSGEEGD